MADNKRPAYAQVMTPEGTLVYPVLNTPDTKFDADGVYKAPLRLNAEDSEAMIAKIDEAFAKNVVEVKKQLEQKIKEAVGAKKGPAQKELKDLKESDKPYKPAYDDEGNETGEYIFTFKMPAQFTSTRGATTGKVVKMKPDLFDAKGKALKGTLPLVYGGTTAIVAGELRPFYTSKVGAGISLRLKAVQIIDLVTAGSGRDASAYGFGEREGGYEATEEAETSSPFADQSGGEEGSTSGDDGNTDF